MPKNLIVARFIDGRVLKGVSLDVDPRKPFCHLRTDDQGSVKVDLVDVKAIFFVRSLIGRPKYTEEKHVTPGDSRLVGTRRVRAVFRDNEEIVGLMNHFPPIATYFFLMPVDPGSNNIRMLVNRDALKTISEITD
jgi:hypothetical protein